jgi:hypothetical protein
MFAYLAVVAEQLEGDKLNEETKSTGIYKGTQNGVWDGTGMVSNSGARERSGVCYGLGKS